MNELYPHFSFSSIPTKSKSAPRARLGKLSTPHGVIETPNFIFCATKASVKGVASHHLKALGTNIILANTYHLMLAPGADLIEKMGGLHKFMGFEGVLLTDSGGYQIFAMGHGSVSEEIKRKSKHFSRASLIKITEEGALFRSYLNGQKFFLAPETSIAIQKKLGADLIVQLDECTPYHVSKSYTERSTKMSLRWGRRSLQAFTAGNDHRQALYRVIQGGIYPELRKMSVRGSEEEPFFGTALGGSLGKDKHQMHDIIAYTTEQLRNSTQPIHLLGIGDVEDIFLGVKEGIDTFDCVKPTRMARHGSIIVPKSVHERGFINLKNAQYRSDPTPLDETKKDFPICRYSRGYLHHLLKAREIAAAEILTQYNVLQMNQLFHSIRVALKNDSPEAFAALEKKWLKP